MKSGRWPGAKIRGVSIRYPSAPARERAAELTAMFADPSIHAVIPPWGGELAVELLPHLDLDIISSAPT
jgi:muramoyltetrapeptide carboxypeptidase